MSGGGERICVTWVLVNVTVSPVSFRVVVVVVELKYSVAVLYPVEGVFTSRGKPRVALGGVRAEDGGAQIPASVPTIVLDDVVEMLAGRSGLLRVRAAFSRSREAVARRRRSELHSR